MSLYDRRKPAYENILRETYGLSLFPIAQDGYCFFSAVLHQVYGECPPANATALRNMVLEIYQFVPSSFWDNVPGLSMDDAYHRLKEVSTFGTNDEIVVLSYLYNRPIYCYNYGTAPGEENLVQVLRLSDDDNMILRNDEVSGPPIHIGQVVADYHFDSLVLDDKSNIGTLKNSPFGVYERRVINNLYNLLYPQPEKSSTTVNTTIRDGERKVRNTNPTTTSTTTPTYTSDTSIPSINVPIPIRNVSIPPSIKPFSRPTTTALPRLQNISSPSLLLLQKNINNNYHLVRRLAPNQEIIQKRQEFLRRFPTERDHHALSRTEWKDFNSSNENTTGTNVHYHPQPILLSPTRMRKESPSRPIKGYDSPPSTNDKVDTSTPSRKDYFTPSKKKIIDLDSPPESSDDDNDDYDNSRGKGIVKRKNTDSSTSTTGTKNNITTPTRRGVHPPNKDPNRSPFSSATVNTPKRENICSYIFSLFKFW